MNLNLETGAERLFPPLRLGVEGKKGFTLLEAVISMSILLMLFSIGMGAWQHCHGKAGETLGKRLILQLEARRALVSLFRELEEGGEVVSPVPGTTLPYLVFKDGLNNLEMVYLQKDEPKSIEEKREIWRAMVVKRDMMKAIPDDPKILMEHVLKLTFTTYHYGGVFISATLRGGRGDFSLVNFVRLQNVAAEDTN